MVMCALVRWVVDSQHAVTGAMMGRPTLAAAGPHVLCNQRLASPEESPAATCTSSPTRPRVWTLPLPSRLAERKGGGGDGQCRQYHRGARVRPLQPHHGRAPHHQGRHQHQLDQHVEHCLQSKWGAVGWVPGVCVCVWWGGRGWGMTWPQGG